MGAPGWTIATFMVSDPKSIPITFASWEHQAGRLPPSWCQIQNQYLSHSRHGSTRLDECHLHGVRSKINTYHIRVMGAPGWTNATFMVSDPKSIPITFASWEHQAG